MKNGETAKIAAIGMHFEECIPGRGVLDYRAYLRGLAAMPRETPLMLEHLKTAEGYLESATYFRKVASETGIRFV